MNHPSTLDRGIFARILEMLNTGQSYLPYLGFLLFFAKQLVGSWEDTIRTRFISVVEVKANDETYNYLMSWVARNGLSQHNHRLLASSTLKSDDFVNSDQAPSYDDEIENTIDETNSLDDLRSKISLYNARPLHWTPAMGTHFFRYENRILSLTRQTDNGGGLSLVPRSAEMIIVSCLGRDATVLKRLIFNARIEYLEREKERTSIYRAAKSYDDDMSWIKCMSKTTRPLSTVVLDESDKQRLVKDLQRYLNPQTKHWYATRGIPYRRGYLFSGPPGTGKTSLTLAAAGLMGLDIYMINLDSPLLSEDNLASLFQNLPRSCLVLLEDIDATRLTHARNAESGDTSAGPKKNGRRGRISLSGLLNVIDGVGAQEGRVLVMTSNHTENIDAALLRPGRVDFSIKFGLATPEAAADIFAQIHDVPYSKAPAAQARKAISDKPATESALVRSLAIEFANKIPELVFSPAAIQGYLLTHQDDPEGAVVGVEAWIQKESRSQDEVSLQVREESDKSAKEVSESESGSDEEEDSTEAERIVRQMTTQ
ncbi:hypothetical protein FZEAL_1063 [Fusarium zealandicum]|uniref:Mitochondrial chaperone bcs1 n=1 Tax=Fusarium zealandicum TaxID=1053134 RepID=A0A8H4XP41_9HYPO|nr:hypothetical protein FZEAL_1063 [Fusarium zealandicum]